MIEGDSYDWRKQKIAATNNNDTVFSNLAQNTTLTQSIISSPRVFDKQGATTLPSPIITHQKLLKSSRMAPQSQSSKNGLNSNQNSYFTNQQLLLIQDDISPLLSNQNLDQFSIGDGNNEGAGLFNTKFMNSHDRLSKTAAQNAGNFAFQSKPSLNDRIANFGGRRLNVRSRLTTSNNAADSEEQVQA